MSELPRPSTPGPWLIEASSDGESWEIAPASDAYIDGDPIPDWSREIALVLDASDGVAIRALPDWIARADRLEALLREARDALLYRIPERSMEALHKRIDAEMHGGDPTPPADDCGHSRGHS